MSRPRCANPECDCQDPYRMVTLIIGHFMTQADAVTAGPPAFSTGIASHDWRLFEHGCGHWAYVGVHCEQGDMTDHNLKCLCLDCIQEEPSRNEQR